MTDAVDKLVNETPGVYRLYGIAWATIASGMLSLSKVRMREFFNSIDPSQSFQPIRPASSHVGLGAAPHFGAESVHEG